MRANFKKRSTGALLLKIIQLAYVWLSVCFGLILTVGLYIWLCSECVSGLILSPANWNQSGSLEDWFFDLEAGATPLARPGIKICDQLIMLSLMHSSSFVS
jgi:hypothetical protein